MKKGAKYLIASTALVAASSVFFIQKRVLQREQLVVKEDAIHCQSNIPARYAVQHQPPAASQKMYTVRSVKTDHSGMVWVPTGTFAMGADNEQASADEYPKHIVSVAGFWMDASEVTNAEFAEFVNATGYITTAEQKPDWEMIREQLPPNTPKPDESLLVPASLVFVSPGREADLSDYTQWWAWQPGADWKHPEGKQSNLVGKENYPVTQVSWEDAQAYCRWAGKRLPFEAEWEFAARGGLKNMIYPWGNKPAMEGAPKANIWQGHFPDVNLRYDKYYLTSPVKSFPPNGYGLYDMAGNVWEWCADYYNNTYYDSCKIKNIRYPKGPATSFDPDEPYAKKRVTRGGSFLCSENYCTGYRVARRMKSTEDSGMENLGFRCVKDQ